MIVNYVPVFHATVLPVHSGNVNDYIYICARHLRLATCTTCIQCLCGCRDQFRCSTMIHMITKTIDMITDAALRVLRARSGGPTHLRVEIS